MVEYLNSAESATCIFLQRTYFEITYCSAHSHWSILSQYVSVSVFLRTFIRTAAHINFMDVSRRIEFFQKLNTENIEICAVAMDEEIVIISA